MYLRWSVTENCFKLLFSIEIKLNIANSGVLKLVVDKLRSNVLWIKLYEQFQAENMRSLPTIREINCARRFVENKMSLL